MVHTKLIKASGVMTFFTAAAYIVIGAAAYVFADAIGSTAEMFFVAASVSLWSGIALLFLSVAALAVKNAGLKKNGSSRPFVCSQLLFIGVTAVSVVGGFALIVLIIAGALRQAGGGTAGFAWWDKALFSVYFLPQIAVTGINAIAMFYNLRESRPPCDENLPANPYASRIDFFNKSKIVVTMLEAAISVAFYLLMTVTAALL